MKHIRIVPTFVGYEVWCGSYLTCTTRSMAAALEEKRYLESLRDEDRIEVSHGY